MITITELAAATLTGCNSCRGCQYLYIKEHGYSNYTVEESTVHCALDKNPNLSDGPEIPWNWIFDQKRLDNWDATQHSMCEYYTRTKFHWVRIPVELDRSIAHLIDEPAYRAIVDHHKRLHGKHPEEYV